MPHHSDAEVLFFYSHARRVWCFLLELHTDAAYYDGQFIGRIHCTDEQDAKRIARYVETNFAGWKVETAGAWTGIRNWIRMHAADFGGVISYLERGVSQVIVSNRKAAT